MSKHNSHQTYGSVAKTFHWLTALLIFTVIPLGLIAHKIPLDTTEQIARKAWLFSAHKTVGITLFFVALARILWAIRQPRPRLLNADKPLESFLAETVHYTLYASLVIVPLMGWAHHAATTGFAPIWWPLGQGLPFIPKDASLAETFALLHMVFERVLLVSLILHIAGAIKHHVIDKDATLRRMLPGTVELPPLAPSASHLRPALMAAAIYGAVFAGVAAAGGLSHAEAQNTEKLEAVASEWSVETGTLDISVNQFGSVVDGGFSDWTAAITFDDTDPRAEQVGSVEVLINIASLSLGSVTDQAKGPDYFNLEQFPTAVFSGPILRATDGYIVDGSLTLKGNTLPLTLPFALTIDGDSAQMSGQTTINRLDFGIGENQPDETNLGFEVAVRVALTARKSQ